MCTTVRIVLAMVREAFLDRAALHLEIRRKASAAIGEPVAW